MNIQDRKKSLTAEELRQRYNFEDIEKTKKATELIRETLNKVEVQFQRFIDIINRSLSEYPSQADGNITAWFFNGIPTTTQPEITTPLDHLGDVYYDRDSGKAYIFVRTKNLFDKENIERNKYYQYNSIGASQNWSISQVPVEPNTNYYLSGNNVNNITARIVLLDSSKNIIQDLGGYKDVHSITTDSNTAYIGLSIAMYPDNNDIDTLQLEKGTSATTYIWEEITDSRTIEVLSIEASAPDTGDTKRVVFINQPTPLYEIGDVWVNGGKYYRCRSKRTEGSFNSLDWIPYTDYTDDMVSADTTAELNRLEKEVEEGYVTNATFETTVNSIDGRVEETYTYATTVKNEADEIAEKVEEVNNTVIANQTATQYSINVINEQLVNGVVKFNTGTGYTFDIEGLKINKADSVIRLILDNNGLVVYRNNDEVLRADSDGVNAENLTVRKFYVQRPLRVEKTHAITDSTKFGLGIFWVGE